MRPAGSRRGTAAGRASQPHADVASGGLSVAVCEPPGLSLRRPGGGADDSRGVVSRGWRAPSPLTVISTPAARTSRLRQDCHPVARCRMSGPLLRPRRARGFHGRRGLGGALPVRTATGHGVCVVGGRLRTASRAVNTVGPRASPVDGVLHHQHLALVPRPLLLLQRKELYMNQPGLSAAAAQRARLLLATCVCPGLPTTQPGGDGETASRGQ